MGGEMGLHISKSPLGFSEVPDDAWVEERRAGRSRRDAYIGRSVIYSSPDVGTRILSPRMGPKNVREPCTTIVAIGAKMAFLRQMECTNIIGDTLISIIITFGTIAVHTYRSLPLREVKNWQGKEAMRLYVIQPSGTIA